MKVVALGELLIDFSSIGVSENGYPIVQANPGGAPINYLAALSKYGIETSFIGKVGNDVFGKQLIETLKGKGIDCSGVILSEDYFTTLAFVTFNEGGERQFSFARKPGADSMLRYEEINLKLIESADVFHFGTVSMTDEPAAAATRRAVEFAKKKGICISFDPNYRNTLWKDAEKAKEAMLWGLQMADIIKISDNEVDFLWQVAPKEGADIIMEQYFAKLVFVTLGAKGCYYKNERSCGTVAAPKVVPIDTTGAGDIFGGSIMSRILKNGKDPGSLSPEELEEMAGFAVKAASLSTEKRGGVESVPDEELVISL